MAGLDIRYKDKKSILGRNARRIIYCIKGIRLYCKNGSARNFAEEMVSSGIVDRVRAEEGNERYEYFFPMEDNEFDIITIL